MLALLAVAPGGVHRIVIRLWRWLTCGRGLHRSRVHVGFLLDGPPAWPGFDRPCSRQRRVRNHPSGRPSYGGANRSSNIKREIGLTVIQPSRCLMCDGVAEDVANLTTLFPVCRCGPLISSL